jgi:hypothetical protein
MKALRLSTNLTTKALRHYYQGLKALLLFLEREQERERARESERESESERERERARKQARARERERETQIFLERRRKGSWKRREQHVYGHIQYPAQNSSTS